jgi:hypothetical protein
VIKVITKIALEKMFEKQYPTLEEYIRKTYGDIAFEQLLDDILDAKE